MGQATRPKTSVRAAVAGVVTKFLSAGLFGLLVSWVIVVFGAELAAEDQTLGTIWITLIWLTPLLWGILDVLYFDKMLNLARNIWESYYITFGETESYVFHVRRWEDMTYPGSKIGVGDLT